MGVRSSLASWLMPRQEREERDVALTLSQYVAQYFTYGGVQYPLGLNSQTITGNHEEVAQTFRGYVESAYQANGVVFACMLARMMLFSQARFRFRQIRAAGPGDLFGTPALSILEHPWTNATTADLLARVIQDADLAGNFYGARVAGGGRQPRIRRMRPDWTSIILGTTAPPYDGIAEDVYAGNLDVDVVGYSFQPGGRGGGQPVQTFSADQVAHFAPIPDPLAHFRGMSWLDPIVREITGDGAAQLHKLKFFENGATSNVWVSFDPTVTKATFDDTVQKFKDSHQGVMNAYKTIFMAGGATPRVIGADFQQMDFRAVQGAGETRMAAAAGVPPIIAGLSEGLAASTYSNYAQARRHFANGTMAWLWRNLAGSFETLVPPPPNSELWYDTRGIPFLAQDETDAAAINSTEASTISTLITVGFEPDAVVDAVSSGDLSRLQGQHSGLPSVQVQPPPAQIPAKGASAQPAPAVPATTNGKKPATNGKKPVLASGN